MANIPTQPEPTSWTYPESLIESLEQRVAELERSVHIREAIIFYLGIALAIVAAFAVSPFR